MVKQFFGRQGQGRSRALIYHWKRLIGKGFVDWTGDTAGVASLSAGDADLSGWDVLSIRFDSFGSQPGPGRRAKNSCQSANYGDFIR